MKKLIFAAPLFSALLLMAGISPAYASAATFSVNTGVTDNVSKVISDPNDSIIVRGTLSTSISPAISAGALNQAITNSGIIETTNAGNPAIIFAGAVSTGSRITNSGTIRTTGGGAAHGIQITPSGSGVTVTNTGTISTSGPGNAVRFVADNNTLTNSGTLITGGSDAIYVDGNNNRITLNPGTSLTGGINFAGGSGNVLEYSLGQSCPAGGGLCTKGLSAAPTITGGTLGNEYTQNVTNLGASSPAVVNNSQQHLVQDATGTAIVTLPTLMAVKTQKIVGLLGAVTAEMAESMANPPPTRNTGVSTGNDYDGHKGHWWVEGYGSYRERPDHGDQSYSESRNAGIVGGYTSPESNDGSYYGIYASGFTGSTDFGKPESRTIDNDGGLIGVAARKSVGAYQLTGHLVAGMSSNDSDRIVGGGGGVASADYNDYFVSPRITVARAFTSRSSYTVTPSITAGYVYSHTESYTETGSLVNQAVESTNNHALMGRAQVEVAAPPLQFQSGHVLTMAYRVGLEGMTGIGSNEINLRALSTNVSFSPDTERTLDGIIGVNLNLDVTDRVQVYFDGQADIGLNNGGTSDNTGGTAKGGITWSF